MAAPTALNETWIACIDSTFTIGTDPNTAELYVSAGGYTLSFGVDEMTNNKSGGAYEDVKTYKKMEGNFTANHVKGDPPVFKAGDIFPVVIDSPDGPYFAGNVRFNQVEEPMLEVNAGVKYKFTVTSQKAFITDRPGP